MPWFFWVGAASVLLQTDFAALDPLVLKLVGVQAALFAFALGLAWREKRRLLRELDELDPRRFTNAADDARRQRRIGACAPE